MAAIDERKSRELRFQAWLHGIELREDGSVKTRGGAVIQNRSHGHLERMKAKYARMRGH